MGFRLFYKNLKHFFCKFRNAIAFLLFGLALISFVFIYTKNRETIKIPLFDSNYDTIAFNLELSKYSETIQNKISVKLNKSKEKLSPIYAYFVDKPTNLAFSTTEPTRKIFIEFPSENEPLILDNIQNLTIFIGKNSWDFNNSEIKAFKKSQIIYDNKTYTQLKIPENVTKYKYAKNINYKGFYNEISIAILSLIYCLKQFLLTWILLFLGLFTIKINDLKINKIIPISLILLLALFLRFNQYTNLSFWWDEHYTFNISGNPLKALESAFSDPGNPPFFALLSKIWLTIGSYSIEWARILPVLFGTFSILTLYILAKDRLNYKIALLSTILMSLSIYHITYSQEYRSYIVSVFLTLIVTIFLFKFLEKQTYSNVFGLLISSTILINNHLFGLLIFFYNICYGNIYYKLNKTNTTKTDILNFAILNVSIGLSFIPFLFLTFYKDAILNTNYNNWIDKISLQRLKLMITTNFGNEYILLGLIILCLIFLITILNKIFKLKLFEIPNQKETNFILYSIFLVIFVFSFTFIFSIYRSILVGYYYILIYPFILILISTFANLKWKHLSINVILSALVLYSLSNMTFNNSWKQNRAYNFLNDIAQIQAKAYPKYLIFSMIDPAEFGQTFPHKNNLIWVGDYNNTDKQTPFINLVKNISNEFKNRKIKLCVLFSELAESDKNYILTLTAFGNMEYYKIPYPYENFVIVITLNQ